MTKFKLRAAAIVLLIVAGCVSEPGEANGERRSTPSPRSPTTSPTEDKRRLNCEGMSHGVTNDYSEEAGLPTADEAFAQYVARTWRGGPPAAEWTRSDAPPEEESNVLWHYTDPITQRRLAHLVVSPFGGTQKWVVESHLRCIDETRSWYSAPSPAAS